MTEAEWLAATEPGRMLAFVREVASERKLRLFTVACCRSLPRPHQDKRLVKLAKVLEKFADDERHVLTLRSRFERVYIEVRRAQAEIHNYPPGTVERRAAAQRATGASTLEPLVSACVPINTRDAVTNLLRLADPPRSDAWIVGYPDLLRDIFNPFRPVTLNPAWLTSTVTAIAAGVYDDRAFDRLPILADALQDAGCEDADILAHLRSDGPHVRGCWAVDLVLGKG